jgi:acylglycerol lipase
MQEQSKYFTSHRGLNLFYRTWQPEGTPRAAVIIVHGIAEHSGRYHDLAAFLVSRQYVVHALDHEGHGQSEGRRGYIHHFEYFIADLDVFVRQVQQQFPQQKVFIFGISMGATIAIAYCLQYPKCCQGLLLSGAALKITPAVSPFLAYMAGIISFMFPRLGMAVLDASTLSRDQAVVTAYLQDPLVNRGKTSARLGAELIRMLRYLPGQMNLIGLPLLIMHGTADHLTDPQGSRWLYERATNRDKTLLLYPGVYHEILNEPGKEAVFQDISLWLDKHT